jgi:hypothetical protein
VRRHQLTYAQNGLHWNLISFIFKERVMSHRLRFVRLIVAVVLALFIGVTLAGAFAEEPLGFRDDGATYPTPPEISTVHDDMTFVLALAAGFSITDAHTLRIWNQLTDSEILTGTRVYSNGIGGVFPPEPNPDMICAGVIHNTDIWPRWQDMTISTSVTSRFGPYSPYFHFPHIDGPRAPLEIDTMHDWAWGLTTTLAAYEAYAWGKPGALNSTVMQATCRYTRTTAITTSIPAGSLPAFATYLHSLADGYSHRDCIAAMDALGMPWATHTTPEIDGSVPACDYHPHTPTSDDVHGREFFTYTDSIRTEEALRHVYLELAARSRAREGVYFPIDLNTPISGAQTLSETIAIFVHTWKFDQADQRRAYADALIAQLTALPRALLYRLWLPVVLKS